MRRVSHNTLCIKLNNTSRATVKRPAIVRHCNLNVSLKEFSSFLFPSVKAAVYCCVTACDLLTNRPNKEDC